MRRLDDDPERGSSATAEGEEQVLILAFVRSTVDAIGGHDLDLNLTVQEKRVERDVQHQRDRQIGDGSSYHAVDSEPIYWGKNAMTAALNAC